MKKIYAPILIGTLNRYLHFKRCIDSLKRCFGAEETILYIALDYPPSQNYLEGYNQILGFINEGIVGFKKVHIIKRESNFGAIKNFIDARKFIFETYDRIIVSEDDNEFSPDFLNFINKGLDTYENRTDILSVCGYIYPIKFKNDPGDLFLYQGFSAWGYGTWKYKFEKLSFNLNEVENCRNSKITWHSISSSLVKSHLKNILKTGHVTRDTYICMYQYLYNMYSIFPKISRVRNHGHDGSGQNCGDDISNYNTYFKQDIYDGEISYLMDLNILPDTKTKLEIDDFLKPKFNLIKHLKSPHKIPKKILRSLFL